VGIKRRRPEQNYIVDHLSRRKTLDDRASPHSLSSSRPRIDRHSDGQGKHQVYAIFPSVITRGRPFKLNLSAFYLVPAIADLLTDGLLSILGQRPNPHTAETVRDEITNGIVRFLKESELSEIAISQFDSALIAAFIAWLNSESEDEVARFSVSTRAGFYTTFRKVVIALRIHEVWKDYVPADLHFRSNAWPKQNSHAKHKTVHNDDLMTRIRVICMEEVSHVITRVRELRRILSAFHETNFVLADVASADVMKQDLPQALYLLSLELRDGLLPTNPNLSSKIKKILTTHGLTASKLFYLFHPTPRTLVPFVILLTMAASYNADVARNFKLDDYRYSAVFSNFIALYPDAANDADSIELEKQEAYDEIQLSAFKGRSNRRQRVYIPVDNQLDNPSVIIDFVTEWTEAIREVAPLAIRRHLFIYSTPRADLRVSSFSGIDAFTSAAMWRYALKQFRDQHRLERFTLDEMRGTILNVTRDIFGGDIKKTAIQANHRNTHTTTASYTSDDEKGRQYQRLGQVHEKRDVLPVQLSTSTRHVAIRSLLTSLSSRPRMVVRFRVDCSRQEFKSAVRSGSATIPRVWPNAVRGAPTRSIRDEATTHQVSSANATQARRRQSDSASFISAAVP
jgi:hypothetical protein